MTQATAACEGVSSSLIVPVFTLSGLDSCPPPALRSFRRLAAVAPAPVIDTHTYPKLDSDLLVGEVVPFLFTWEQHYSDPTALSGVDQ